MIVSIGFYSLSTLLIVGIISNTREVIKINKQRKKLKELVNILDKNTTGGMTNVNVE